MHLLAPKAPHSRRTRLDVARCSAGLSSAAAAPAHWAAASAHLAREFPASAALRHGRAAACVGSAAPGRQSVGVRAGAANANTRAAPLGAAAAPKECRRLLEASAMAARRVASGRDKLFPSGGACAAASAQPGRRITLRTAMYASAEMTAEMTEEMTVGMTDEMTVGMTNEMTAGMTAVKSMTATEGSQSCGVSKLTCS